METKPDYTLDFLKLEPIWYELTPMLELLFNAIKYNEENSIQGEYSYLISKIERRMKKINDLF